MLAPNTVLQERYRIVRPLGQGGMGAVYEAVDERLGKTIAIKEVLITLATGSDPTQRELIKKAFRREANSLVKAKHEAVPDVTDYFSELDRQFLVMEYIEGDDLAKMLQKRQRPFQLQEVLPWMDQLLEALDYLHNLQPPIIHRDIKPQNLKLNVWKKIKLLDFGIAKSTDKSNTITQQTFIGATLNYSPIEQILRVIAPTFREYIILTHGDNARRILAQNTDVRCDIFALGATFYHLLTNYPPVDITKRTLESWEGKKDPLPDPAELNPELPRPVSEWLKKSMAIERDDRFGTAFEMRQALKRAVLEANRGSQLSGRPAAEAPDTMTAEKEDLSAADAKTEKFVFDTKEIPGKFTEDIPSKTQPSFPDFAIGQNVPESGEPAPADAVERDPSETSASRERSDEEPVETEKEEADTITRTARKEATAPAAGLAASAATTPPAGITAPATDSAAAVPTGPHRALKGNLKLLLLVPLFMFGLLAAGGIGGLIWWYGSDVPGPNSPDADVRTSPTPGTTPEALTAADEDDLPPGEADFDGDADRPPMDDTEQESASPPTSDDTEIRGGQPPARSSPTPRRAATPTPRPRRTPPTLKRKTPTPRTEPAKTPVRRPPTPKPAKTVNTDCIYTDDCR